MKNNGLVYVVDDEPCVREGLVRILEALGYEVEAFADGPAFLRGVGDEPACVLLDACLSGMDGLAVMAALSNRRCDLPVIFMSGHCDFSLCVRAMKAGAVDFLLKPLRQDDLAAAVTSAHLAHASRRRSRDESQRAAEMLSRLTMRERQVLALVLEGRRNKQIAAELDSQEATVKVHRSRLMRKLGVRTLPDLVRIGDRGRLASTLNRDADAEFGPPARDAWAFAPVAGAHRAPMEAVNDTVEDDGWRSAQGDWRSFTWRAPS